MYGYVRIIDELTQINKPNTVNMQTRFSHFLHEVAHYEIKTGGMKLCSWVYRIQDFNKSLIHPKEAVF